MGGHRIHVILDHTLERDHESSFLVYPQVLFCISPGVWVFHFGEEFGVQIIALRETKLKESTHIRPKGYHVLRLDRRYEGGERLAFLVRTVKYLQIHYSLVTNSVLELQGIRIFSGMST
ncbi:hypothetical protein NPIL_594261 [Nephila pilipes]|uniref:Uncharacterized protein n=1 Tax=Nephila pilipes TaxID=299642 RepID=A0A8X6PI02_NEPPI|nr:hypothetical protein NPIL_594261 [Nephila pilipes]